MIFFFSRGGGAEEGLKELKGEGDKLMFGNAIGNSHDCDVQ